MFFYGNYYGASQLVDPEVIGTKWCKNYLRCDGNGFHWTRAM